MGSHPAARAAIQRVAALIALAALTITAVPVSRADASLTLAEAQRLAVERSRMLAGQDSAVAASRELAVAAGQLPDPMLKLGIDNLPVDTSDRFSLTRDFMTMRQIGLMQEITRSDKRQARADRFEREAEKTLAERQATIAAIQRNAALAWLDRYYAEAMAAVVAEPGDAGRNRSCRERVSRRTRQSCRRPGRSCLAGRPRRSRQRARAQSARGQYRLGTLDRQ
jgi:hypothetical protein